MTNQIINASIKEIRRYDPSFRAKMLTLYQLDDISSGLALRKSSFLLDIRDTSYAISKWTGPKRSRTYPYQHVYDTMRYRPRVTIIPYFKDEGADGNPDYLQWDTISLMSLLNVYVILAYHVSAKPNLRNPDRQRITGHQLDYAYVRERLEELSLYHSDPIHWNMRELNEKLLEVMQRTLRYHQQIALQTGVRLHSPRGLVERIERLQEYRTESRARALLAQAREQVTEQVNERVSSGLKASINITNFYNGEYYLTVDETFAHEDRLFLIEKKHSSTKKMPASSDVKDALLKLILFSNLDSAELNGVIYRPAALLGLTSDVINGWCHNRSSHAGIAAFIAQNPQFTSSNIKMLQELFHEANANHIGAYVVNANFEQENRAELMSELSAHQ